MNQQQQQQEEEQSLESMHVHLLFSQPHNKSKLRIYPFVKGILHLYDISLHSLKTVNVEELKFSTKCLDFVLKYLVEHGFVDAQFQGFIQVSDQYHCLLPRTKSPNHN